MLKYVVEIKPLRFNPDRATKRSGKGLAVEFKSFSARNNSEALKKARKIVREWKNKKDFWRGIDIMGRNYRLKRLLKVVFSR